MQLVVTVGTEAWGGVPPGLAHRFLHQSGVRNGPVSEQDVPVPALLPWPATSWSEAGSPLYEMGLTILTAAAMLFFPIIIATISQE